MTESEVKATDYSREQILDAISRAVQAHDMPPVVTLLGMLAIVSPRDAEQIVNVMKIGRSLLVGDTE